MKAEDKAKKIIAERKAKAASMEEWEEKARQEVERLKGVVSDSSAALDFETFKEARRQYEDAEAYLSLIQKAKKEAQQPTATDMELYKEICEELTSLYNAEPETAHAEAKKPAAELVKIYEKHQANQQKIADLERKLRNALNIPANIVSFSNGSYRDIVFSEVSTLYKEAQRLTEEA